MRFPLARRSDLDQAFRLLRASRGRVADLEADLATQQNRAGENARLLAAARREADGLRARLAETVAERDDARREVEDAARRNTAENLSAEEIRDLLKRFQDGGGCQTCAGIHVRSCPRVRSVEYEARGDKVTIRRVQFWRTWDDSGTIYSDMLPDPDEVEAREKEPG